MPSKRKVLVQSRHITDWPLRQITKTREARETLKNIFSDETWMDSKRTFRKYQQGPGILGVINTVSGDTHAHCCPHWDDGLFSLQSQLVFIANSRVRTTKGKYATIGCPYGLQASRPTVVMDNAPYDSMTQQTGNRPINKT
jgi:hypothetical protein